MIAGEELTKDFADLLYTAGNVVFLYGVTHWYANITVEAIAEMQTMIIIALSSNIQYTPHA